MSARSCIYRPSASKKFHFRSVLCVSLSLSLYKMPHPPLPNTKPSFGPIVSLSICVSRVSFVSSHPLSDIATNRRVTRASSISCFFLAPLFCFPPCPPRVHTRDSTVHFAERYTAARSCPIRALTECCLSPVIVSPHFHKCVTSGILPSLSVLYSCPSHVSEFLRGRVLVLLPPFTFLLIELTRGPFVLASLTNTSS